MADTDYSAYLVTKPIYEDRNGIKQRSWPRMTYVSSQQIPEAKYHLSLSWIHGIPDPNPRIPEHVHDYDEILLYWGSDSEAPQVLGGEVCFYIGGQPIRFNTTSAIFIPKGTRHGPVIWEKFHFPHVEMTLKLGTGEGDAAYHPDTDSQLKKELPHKDTKFDYEQYVIRSPVREVGPPTQTGRQNPSMTYMSKSQINNARSFIEFGWIWDEIGLKVSEMVHNNSDEIVLHIGGDPDHPEDLGTDMELSIEGQRFLTSSSCAAYIPRGTRHGPIIWRQVNKPFIEMAILLNVGSMREAWQVPAQEGSQ